MPRRAIEKIHDVIRTGLLKGRGEKCMVINANIVEELLKSD